MKKLFAIASQIKHKLSQLDPLGYPAQTIEQATLTETDGPRLESDTFKRYYKSEEEMPYGLEIDQMRPSWIPSVQNAGWYNEELKRIGYGDFSIIDAINVAQNMPSDELLIIYYESDWRWKNDKIMTAKPAARIMRNVVYLDNWNINKNRMRDIDTQDVQIIGLED